MQTVQPDILLINLPARLFDEPDRYISVISGKAAPLGLYCLSAIDPQRIQVVDAASLSSIFDCLSSMLTGHVFSLLFQLPENLSSGKLRPVIEKIRRIFPAACLGAGSCNSAASELMDFTFSGTGKTLLLRILRGERLSGFYDSLNADLATLITVPEFPLVESVSEIPPEKWLGGQTIEINQPWLGFLDQAKVFSSYPGISWINELVVWLKNSGYSAFHFRASGIKSDHLHELRSVMLNLKADFAVSFRVDEAFELPVTGLPLREIWLEGIDKDNASMAAAAAEKIHSAGCLAGMLIDYSWNTISEKSLLVNSFDRMLIADIADWKFSDLKHFTGRFWGAKRRFFVRLFSIKKAAELIMFMKTAYAVLDILLTSEKNGR